jgi:hypothetical protein
VGTHKNLSYYAIMLSSSPDAGGAVQNSLYSISNDIQLFNKNGETHNAVIQGLRGISMMACWLDLDVLCTTEAG